MYGSPRITHEQRRSSETCGENRVAKLMKQAKLRANIGYKRHYIKPSTPHISADNHLQQQFVVCEPDTAWVGDITYIKTYKGWLYLAVVLDLFSRKVIGWSYSSGNLSVYKAGRRSVDGSRQKDQFFLFGCLFGKNFNKLFAYIF